MGLDITVYQGLTKVENPELDADGYPVNWETQYKPYVGGTERDFPGRTKGLPDSNAVYSYTDKFGFRAGSYDGYNIWRNQLATLANYGDAKECWENHDSGPFYELIEFYDSEGTIGPVIAAKLAKDFAEFKEKAEFAHDEYFFQRYCDWEKAFKMASDNGAVVFH